MTSSPVIFLSAGEKSGDKLGAALARDLLKTSPALRLFGVGGGAMKEAGVEIIENYDALSVMGYWDVIRSLPSIYLLRKEILNFFSKNSPHLFIGIDAPDFHLPLARHLRTKGVRTVQYVSPSVWMWRKERLKKIKETVDAVWCLFPFEKKIYEEANIPVEFIGHPAAFLSYPSRKEARQRLGIDEESETIAVLLGSRQSEIKQHLPLIEAVIKRLGKNNRCFVTACARQEDANMICQRIPTLKTGDIVDVLAASDVGLVKSGTVTLEAAMAQLPMIVFFKASFLETLIAKNRQFLLPYFSLPNILSNRFLVPELLLDEANAETMAREVERLLTDKARCQRIKKSYQHIQKMLQRGKNTPVDAALNFLRC